jgi:hypothetical protein
VAGIKPLHFSHPWRLSERLLIFRDLAFARDFSLSVFMIPADIHFEIMRRLERTEKEEGVRIVLAIESGSRAWGFASPNSDYDVRFIYVRPSDWYLAVDLERSGM